MPSRKDYLQMCAIIPIHYSVYSDSFFEAQLFIQSSPSNCSLAELRAVLFLKGEQIVIHHFMVTAGDGIVQYCLDTFPSRQRALKVKIG